MFGVSTADFERLPDEHDGDDDQDRRAIGPELHDGEAYRGKGPERPAHDRNESSKTCEQPDEQSILKASETQRYGIVEREDNADDTLSTDEGRYAAIDLLPQCAQLIDVIARQPGIDLGHDLRPVLEGVEKHDRRDENERDEIECRRALVPYAPGNARQERRHGRCNRIQCASNHAFGLGIAGAEIIARAALDQSLETIDLPWRCFNEARRLLHQNWNDKHQRKHNQEHDKGQQEQGGCPTRQS